MFETRSTSRALLSCLAIASSNDGRNSGPEGASKRFSLSFRRLNAGIDLGFIGERRGRTRHMFCRVSVKLTAQSDQKDEVIRLRSQVVRDHQRVREPYKIVASW